MFELLLYILIVLTIVLFMAILLPVNVFFQTAGGTEEGVGIEGRILFFSGIFGGGVLYRKSSRCRFNVFLFSRRLLSINIQPFVEYLSRKPEKKSEKKAKPLKKKLSIFERIKIYYHKTFEYRGYFKEGIRDFREIIRIDLFSANITFGFGNPALMGKLIGIIYVINSILPHPYEIIPSWDFTKRIIKGELTIKITFLSHVFWRKFFFRLPLIVSIIKRRRSQKRYSNEALVVKETI